ncbi:MAG: hypothetical protein ACI9XP_000747 [Lentimonas sp.]|jgi:hypothetical protein
MNKATSIIILGTLLIFCTLTISCKKERNVEATIITDCTGTYLRFDSKDYKVCNLEKTENYTHKQTVEVTFKKMVECDGSGNILATCFLNHPFEAWAQVIKIK